MTLLSRIILLSNHRTIALPLFALLLLGFTSGLPLALTASTLAIRLTESGVDKTSIGLFAAVSIPYAFKFLWAPLVDSLPFPLLTYMLGRRRGWLIGAQCALIGALLLLAGADPSIMPLVTALAALLVAFCSATQDIIIDAYRVELLPREQQGTASATYVLGYRLGMIVSSAGALYLATYAGWFTTYAVMAGIIGLGILAAFFAGEPKHGSTDLPPAYHNLNTWIKGALIAPFREFALRDAWFVILAFTALYKLPDAFIGLMSSAFFIDIGFTKPQIADIAKLYGLIATIAGGFIGGWLVTRGNLLRLLWIIGLAQGVTNLLYVLLVHNGPDMATLALVITGDNLISGMSGTIFVAYLSGLCNARFTATQYALLSSLASASRAVLSTPAGWVAEELGWSWFFSLSALLTIPALVLLLYLQQRTKTT